MSIEDLKPGMEITGTVRNVVDFGAFIDIGVHQDGLVHISEITDRYIRHPSEVLKVGQVVKVTVKEADIKKNRIALTMKRKTDKSCFLFSVYRLKRNETSPGRGRKRRIRKTCFNVHGLAENFAKKRFFTSSLPLHRKKSENREKSFEKILKSGFQKTPQGKCDMSVRKA